MSQSDISQQESRTNDEIDLRDIILPLWLAKWRIILWGLLIAIIAGVYQLGGIALDRGDQARLQVHFNFKGANEGVYPNKAQFSPQELLSDAVLSEVYARQFDQGEEYDIFKQSLTLTPSLVGEEQLDGVITNLAAKDKGLSVAEFNEVVQAYSENLQSLSRTNATLTLDLKIVNGNQSKAAEILTDIVDTWASQAIKVRGVLNISNPTITNQTIIVADEELLVNVNILSDTHILLSNTVSSLNRNPQLTAISDPETGFTLTDLSHQLSTEGKYKIAIFKEMIIKSGFGAQSAIWYEGFRKARLGKLKRERDSLERMVSVYDDAIIQFNQQQDIQQQIEPSPAQSTTQIYSPQYSNDLINSLLSLGSKMANPEYRKQLLEEKINLSSRLQNIITEIEFYESADANENTPLDIEKISQLVKDSSLKLASINDALASITNIANEGYLADNGKLYDLQGNVAYVTTSNLSNRTILRLILAFIAGCFIGVLMVFVRILVLPNTKNE